MSRREFAAAVALLAGSLATGLVGCPAATPSNVVTLRFWGMGREGEVVAELTNQFEREHPGIRVRVQQIPWTAAHEKLLTGFVGNATPDVAQLGNTWVPEFVALHALAPLDRRVAASADVPRDDYFAGIWDTNVLNDTTYGIPWYVDTRVIFYRTDMLAKAGYTTPPSTWDGWLDAMRKVKRALGPGRYAILLPTNEWPQPIILGLQQGSTILRNGDRFGAFREAEFRRAFEFYLGLFREGLAPAVSNTQIANLYEQFARGDFAMYITGPWNIGEFARRLPPAMNGKWGTMPLPTPSGSPPGVSLAGGSSLVLFRASEHPSEAWQLIEFLSRPEQQLRFARLTGDLPARKTAWQDTSLIGNRYARAFWEQLQHVTPTPKVPEWEQIATKVFDYSDLAIRGALTPDRALGALDRDVDAILEKRRYLLSRKASLAAASSSTASPAR